MVALSLLPRTFAYIRISLSSSLDSLARLSYCGRQETTKAVSTPILASLLLLRVYA